MPSVEAYGADHGQSARAASRRTPYMEAIALLSVLTVHWCGNAARTEILVGDAAKRDQQRASAFLSEALVSGRTARRASSGALPRTCDPLGLGRAPTGFSFGEGCPVGRIRSTGQSRWLSATMRGLGGGCAIDGMGLATDVPRGPVRPRCLVHSGVLWQFAS